MKSLKMGEVIVIDWVLRGAWVGVAVWVVYIKEEIVWIWAP